MFGHVFLVVLCVLGSLLILSAVLPLIGAAIESIARHATWIFSGLAALIFLLAQGMEKADKDFLTGVASVLAFLVAPSLWKKFKGNGM